MMKTSLLALVMGYIIDLIVGDPYVIYHPVRMIGNLISWLEKKLNTEKFKDKKRKFGVVLTILVVCISTLVPFALLYIAYQIHTVLGVVVETIMCYQLLATKSLKVESMKVYHALKDEDLPQARKAISMIVGRDTDQLTKDEISKAAVETVAENTADGVVAPMIFMALGGATLGFFYKSINTLDSMVGYKDERYAEIGRCSALLDDVVNFFPSRISAVLMIIASYLGGYHGADAVRCFKRDRFCHPSPNSAQTESVMAGALGVQLAGDAYYFGKKVRKATIGDHKRPIEIEDIKRANHLLYMTSCLSLLLCVGVKGFFLFAFGVLK
ncbi:MAG TPA: cobalamin biosynthesis protein CobD [Candidatus Merdenecus merdavium]|nr:cobalamin biosynthesis protein CobD [Candidatus Merdenecus merdavium]